MKGLGFNVVTANPDSNDVQVIGAMIAVVCLRTALLGF